MNFSIYIKTNVFKNMDILMLRKRPQKAAWKEAIENKLENFHETNKRSVYL